MNTTKLKIEYVERLRRKGISCVKHDSCSGCQALTVLEKEKVVGDKGFARKNLSLEELRHYGLFGECDLGFEQEWETWGKAIPIEPCPKPLVEEDLLRCIMRSD